MTNQHQAAPPNKKQKVLAGPPCRDPGESTVAENSSSFARPGPAPAAASSCCSCSMMRPINPNDTLDADVLEQAEDGPFADVPPTYSSSSSPRVVVPSNDEVPGAALFSPGARAVTTMPLDDEAPPPRRRIGTTAAALGGVVPALRPRNLAREYAAHYGNRRNSEPAARCVLFEFGSGFDFDSSRRHHQREDEEPCCSRCRSAAADVVSRSSSSSDEGRDDDEEDDEEPVLVGDDDLCEGAPLYETPRPARHRLRATASILGNAPRRRRKRPAMVAAEAKPAAARRRPSSSIPEEVMFPLF